MLNEPLSNLDAVLRISVQVALKRLQKEPGITTIYVTHDQAEALAIADKIVLVDEGRIAQIGAPEEVYNKPAMVSVGGFLGNPLMTFIETEIDYSKEKPLLLIGGNTLSPGAVPRPSLET